MKPNANVHSESFLGFFAIEGLFDSLTKLLYSKFINSFPNVFLTSQGEPEKSLIVKSKFLSLYRNTVAFANFPSFKRSRDSCDALVGGVGRHDGDEVQARLAGGLVPFGLGLAHARREVGNEHGVCARVGGGLHEAPDAGGRDEVDVEHEADGRLGMCGPEPAQYVEAACGRGAVGEGPVGGGLDDGAVGARVGERDPEL